MPSRARARRTRKKRPQKIVLVPVQEGGALLSKRQKRQARRFFRKAGRDIVKGAKFVQKHKVLSKGANILAAATGDPRAKATALALKQAGLGQNGGKRVIRT
jgi:hypothetical protein